MNASDVVGMGFISRCIVLLRSGVFMFLGAILLSVVVLVFSSSMVSESWSSMSFFFCIVRVSLKSFAFPIVLPYVMISFLSNRPHIL